MQQITIVDELNKDLMSFKRVLKVYLSATSKILVIKNYTFIGKSTVIYY